MVTFICSHRCISSSEVTQISPRFVQSRYRGKSSSLCRLSTVAGPHPIRSAITLNVRYWAILCYLLANPLAFCHEASAIPSARLCPLRSEGQMLLIEYKFLTFLRT